MLAIAILATGKGTRMNSDLPKVLQPLAGATLVERVLGSCERLHPSRQLLIVGHQAERVQASLQAMAGLEFVLQQPQNGTGHAMRIGEDGVKSIRYWMPRGEPVRWLREAASLLVSGLE